MALLLPALCAGASAGAVKIAYEGRLVPGARGRDVARRFEAWARKKRVGAVLSPGGSGVTLILHPAGRGVRLDFDAQGRFSGSVVTSDVGPGYHEAVVGVLDALKRDFAPGMKAQDDSGYWAGRRRTALEKKMLADTQDTLKQALRKWPAQGVGRLATRMGEYDRKTVERWLREIGRRERLCEWFVWWGPGRDGGYWTNLGCVIYRLRLMGRERAVGAGRLILDVERYFKRGRALGRETWLSRYYEGRIAAARGKSADAIAAYSGALKLNPDQPDVLFALGAELTSAGRAGEAESVLETLAKAAPRSAVVFYRLGLARCMAGEYRGGLTALDKAAELEPDFAAAWAERGIALRGLKRHKEALASVEKSLKLDPRNVDAWHTRSVILTDMGRLRMALICLRQCLALDPRRYDALIALGLAQMKLRQTDAALRTFQRAARVAPDRWEAFCNLGALYKLLGREGDANRALAEAKRLAERREGQTGKKQ